MVKKSFTHKVLFKTTNKFKFVPSIRNLITDYLDRLYERTDLSASSVLDIQDNPFCLAPGRYDCASLDENHQKFVRYAVERTKELGRTTLIIRTPVRHPRKPIKLTYDVRALAILLFLSEEAEKLGIGELGYVPEAEEDTSNWLDLPMVRYNISETGLSVYIIPGLSLEEPNPLLKLENALVFTGRPENKSAWESIGIQVDDLVPKL